MALFAVALTGASPQVLLPWAAGCWEQDGTDVISEEAAGEI